jgi:hypothetical protein
LFLSDVGFPLAAGVPAVAGDPDAAVALLFFCCSFQKSNILDYLNIRL